MRKRPKNNSTNYIYHPGKRQIAVRFPLPTRHSDLFGTLWRHIEHGCQAFTLPQRAGVTLKLQKYSIFTKESVNCEFQSVVYYIKFPVVRCVRSTNTTDYRGFVTQNHRLKLAVHTADSIKHLQLPRNIAELQSFPPLGNAFRPLGTNYACIAALVSRKPQINNSEDCGTSTKKIRRQRKLFR